MEKMRIILSNIFIRHSINNSPNQTLLTCSCGHRTLSSLATQPSSTYKARRRATVRYTIQDAVWARKVAKKMRTLVDFQDPEVVVVDCNPGNGVLTRSLLMRSQIQVIALTHHQKTAPNLQELSSSNKYFRHRLSVAKGNVTEIRHLLGNLGHNGVNRGEADWEEVSPIRLLGTTFPPSMLPSYVNLLSYEVGARNHVYSLGRVESFLFVGEDELKVLGHKCKDDMLYNNGALRSALYKVFFDVSVLLKIPKTAFNTNGNGDNNHHTTEGECIYLVRLAPRYPQLCPPGDVPGLIRLLRELRRHRGKTVTGAMDVMYPDLTEAVMSQGFSADDTISDLTVDQVLAMHKVLSAQPHCLTFDLDDVDQEQTTSQ